MNLRVLTTKQEIFGRVQAYSSRFSHNLACLAKAGALSQSQKLAPVSNAQTISGLFPAVVDFLPSAFASHRGSSWMEASALANEIPKMNDTDRLVELARAGNQSAQQQLFSRHRDQLKKMIAVFLDQRVAARVDASDVLQETLACAVRRLPEYSNAHPGGFYPWLRQIAKDRIVDTHRRHIFADKRSVGREFHAGPLVSAASASDLAEQLSGGLTSPVNCAIRNERANRIAAGISKVSDDHREMLLMRYVEHLTPREISQLLSISESAVKSKLWRALEKLKQAIGILPEDRE